MITIMITIAMMMIIIIIIIHPQKRVKADKVYYYVKIITIEKQQ